MAAQVLREAGPLNNVAMAILSDANSVYIDTVAEARGLQVCLHVMPYVSGKGLPTRPDSSLVPGACRGASVP